LGLLLLDDLTPQGAYLAVRATWKLAYEDALMAKDVVRRAQNHPKGFISVYFPSIRPHGSLLARPAFYYYWYFREGDTPVFL